MAWTEKETADCTRMMREGRDARRIALALGKTRNSVIAKMTRMYGSFSPHRGRGRPPGTSTPTPAPKPKATTVPVVPLRDSRPKERITILTLEPQHCRWPIGTPGDENFHFCGGEKKLGSVYCEPHHEGAYVKPKPYRRARK